MAAPEKKSTIYMNKQKTVLAPFEKYSAEKRRICYLHLKLAALIQDSSALDLEKVEMLDLLDEAFDRGKRMDEALATYKRNSTSQESAST